VTIADTIALSIALTNETVSAFALAPQAFHRRVDERPDRPRSGSVALRRVRGSRPGHPHFPWNGGIGKTIVWTSRSAGAEGRQPALDRRSAPAGV